MNKVIKSFTAISLLTVAFSAFAVESRNHTSSVYVNAESFPEVVAKASVVEKIVEDLDNKCAKKSLKVNMLTLQLDVNCYFQEKRWYGPREDSIKCEGSGTAQCRKSLFGM